MFPVDSGAIVDLVYSTIYQNEHSYKVYDQFGALIHEKTSAANNGNGPESTYGIQLCDPPNLIIEKEKDIFIYPNPAKNSFSINEIYEEIFQRTINPLYIVILSLLSSLLVIKPKIDFIYNNLKIILFGFGFLIILFSQLSYRFIFFNFEIEMIFLVLPILLIFFFYIFLLIKTNFKINLL